MAGADGRRIVGGQLDEGVVVAVPAHLALAARLAKGQPEAHLPTGAQRGGRQGAAAVRRALWAGRDGGGSGGTWQSRPQLHPTPCLSTHSGAGAKQRLGDVVHGLDEVCLGM